MMTRPFFPTLALLSLLALGCGKKDAETGAAAEKPADSADNPFKLHQASVQGLLDVFDKAGDADKAIVDGQKYVDENRAAVVANCKTWEAWAADVSKGSASKYSFDYQELQKRMQTLAGGDFKKMGKLLKVLEEVRICDTVLKKQG